MIADIKGRRPIFTFWKNWLKFCLCLSFFYPHLVSAQWSKPTEVSIGYFAPIPFEYGIRSGIRSQLLDAKYRTLLLTFHAGYFQKRLDNSNIYLGPELGLQFSKEAHKRTHTFSLGAGYLMQFEVTSFTLNLQGEIINQERELRHIFLPTINYEYALWVGDQWVPYGKLGFGYKLSEMAPNAGVLLGEFGVRFLMHKTDSDDE